METRIQAAAKVGRRLCFALLVTQTGIALADDELRISEASWDDGRLRVSGRRRRASCNGRAVQCRRRRRAEDH